MLQFLTGPAGCGKSVLIQDTVISDAVKNPEKKYFFIVPDQFTMQTQMDIVKRHPAGGIMNIDVLSFGRLSYRIFEETGYPDHPTLDDTGKSLVLRHIAGDLSNSLPYLGKNLSKIGYIHEIKSRISEFMQYGLDPNAVDIIASETTNELLRLKLSDLSKIYRAFTEYNKNKFVTNEETLGILAEKIKSSDILKGATIVFDGFTGFTPIQERVIREILKIAERVYITYELSLPETPDSESVETSLFYMSKKSMERLKKIAEEESVEVLETMDLSTSENKRLSARPDLLFLEKNLFRFKGEKYRGPVENIFVTRCKNPSDEVRNLILKIDELVRDHDYSYRDIAVIAGDLETYSDVVWDKFTMNNIPFYLDRTSAVLLNPFVEYIESAMEIIIKDYNYDSVLRFLRSGFSNFTEEETDAFDKYIASLNLRGKRNYKKPFTRVQRGMKDPDRALLDAAKQDDLRARIFDYISIIDKPFNTCREFVGFLYEFIVKNDSFTKLSNMAAQFEEAGDSVRAREYKQIYRLIMELLDTIVMLIGDEELSIKEFYDIFSAGIDEIQVGTLPENVDRVVVGDLTRTRLKDIKALFFLGMNDGFVPKAAEKTGILTGRDKEVLRERGIELSRTAKEEIYIQRLYLYMYLCKPSQKLFISYSDKATDGSSMKKSYVCDAIIRMYEGLQEGVQETAAKPENILNEKDGLGVYSELLRTMVREGIDAGDNKEALSFANALHRFYAGEEHDGLHNKIEEAAFFKYFPTDLSKEVIAALYGSIIRLSISRMELFANCAYAHFLRYGMKLKQEENFDFNYMDLGNVCHGVLESFSNKLIGRGLSFSDFDEETGKTLVDEALAEYAEKYEQGILKEDAERKYLTEKIRKVLYRTVDTLKFQASRGMFKESLFEYKFRSDLDLNEAGPKTYLEGKIDRIDVYSTDSKVYVKIIDYKSSQQSLDVTRIYNGLSQQLFMYLSEAMKKESKDHPGKEIVPSGMFYYALMNPFVEEDTELSQEELNKEIYKKLQLDGSANSDLDNLRAIDKDIAEDSMVLPFKLRGSSLTARSIKAVTPEEMQNALNFVNEKAVSIAKEIINGSAEVKPVKIKDETACAHCDYRSICKFDEALGYKYRRTDNVTQEEAKNAVFEGVSDGN